MLNSGHSIYASQATAEGQIPIKDFNWIYGPLMLYYNAFFLKILGSSIHSLIWGKIILKSIFSCFFFLAARRIMPSLAALIGLLSYSILTLDFEHNFNHYGGVCMEIGILWAVLSYTQRNDKTYIYVGLLFVLLLGLIKLNFGIAFLFGSILCFILCDLLKHKSLSLKYYLFGALTTLALWVFVYSLLIQGLSTHEIFQCFPIYGKYLYFHVTPLTGFIALLKNKFALIQHSRFDLIIASLSSCSALILTAYIVWYKKKGLSKPTKLKIILVSLILFVLINIGYHEYYKGGQPHEMYWAYPFTIMMVSYLISEACVICFPAIRIAVVLLCIWILASTALNNWRFLESCKNLSHFYNHKKLNIYSPDAPWDAKQLMDVVHYIETRIPPNEMFFALPESSIYYFMTGRLSPYRLTYVMKANLISRDQEIELIKTLEDKKVNFIIVDNVCYFGQIWGVFGQDNCPLLYTYIHKYFKEDASISMIPNSPWHGTIAYKRAITGKNIHEIILSLEKP